MKRDLARRGAPHALAVALVLATAAVGLGTTGCRVNKDDISRWETTAHGPDKLKAVVLHDKYDYGLRTDAAVSLIRMKPRQGRRIGITILVDALASIPPDQRQAIVSQLVPHIIDELKAPPPVGQAGQPSPPDASFPYKDAAFAMLTADRTVIVSDEALKQQLRTALTGWAMADFEHRLDNRTQSYGMEQLLRYLGPEGVAGLPKLMTRDAKRLDQMASLVAEIGDPKAKEAASGALVTIAQFVVSDEWRKLKEPELQKANAASKLEPTPEQFKAQLDQYQDEELFRVFASMKKVGGRPVVDFLLVFAGQKAQSEKRRQAALAALEGRLDKDNADDVKRIVEIASSPDAPDVVLDQAFRRIGEMPREKVVARLYDIFRTDKWKVRRAAAVTVLRMSTLKDVDEFMGKLVEGKGFAMPEALTYGATIGDLKGEGKPADAVKKWMTSGSAAARTTAISYWFTYGTKNDVGQVQELEGEKGAVPVCETDPDCKWSCEIQKEGSNDPKERETKDIKTIGEFVKYCVEPAMKERQPEAKK